MVGDSITKLDRIWFFDILQNLVLWSWQVAAKHRETFPEARNRRSSNKPD